MTDKRLSAEQENARYYLEHDEPFATNQGKTKEETARVLNKNQLDDLDKCTCHRKLGRCCDNAYCGLLSGQ